ncbi:MAG: hypothetical protein WCR54_06840 [Clostridia bacterium]
MLVIPEEIDGIKVQALHKWELSMQSSGLVWKSKNLEKIFFPTNRSVIDNSTFDSCINLKKTILLDIEPTNAIIGGGYEMLLILIVMFKN